MARWVVRPSVGPDQSLPWVGSQWKRGSETAIDGSGILVQNSEAFIRWRVKKASAIGCVNRPNHIIRRLLCTNVVTQASVASRSNIAECSGRQRFSIVLFATVAAAACQRCASASCPRSVAMRDSAERPANSAQALKEIKSTTVKCRSAFGLRIFLPRRRSYE